MGLAHCAALAWQTCLVWSLSDLLEVPCCIIVPRHPPGSLLSKLSPNNNDQLSTAAYPDRNRSTKISSNARYPLGVS